jgi:hypothetical protein
MMNESRLTNSSNGRDTIGRGRGVANFYRFEAKTSGVSTFARGRIENL